MFIVVVTAWQAALQVAGAIDALALVAAWAALVAYRPRHTHRAIAANRVSVQLRRSR